jgi:hypothetical protein
MRRRLGVARPHDPGPGPTRLERLAGDTAAGLPSGASAARSSPRRRRPVRRAAGRRVGRAAGHSARAAAPHPVRPAAGGRRPASTRSTTPGRWRRPSARHRRSGPRRRLPAVAPPASGAAAAPAAGNVRRIFNGADVISVPMNADYTQVDGAAVDQRPGVRRDAGRPGRLLPPAVGRPGPGRDRRPGGDGPRLLHGPARPGRDGRQPGPGPAAAPARDGPPGRGRPHGRHGRRRPRPAGRRRRTVAAAVRPRRPAASALQGGMDPAAAANQALRAREAFSDYQRRAGDLGIGPARPGQPGSPARPAARPRPSRRPPTPTRCSTPCCP